MVKDIQPDGTVELLSKHDFEDGDLILINNVVGMIDKDNKSINGNVFKIKTKNKTHFQLLELP